MQPWPKSSTLTMTDMNAFAISHPLHHLVKLNGR